MSYVLYDYFRSTASYRVRLALHAKQMAFETKAVHLVNQGGEQHLPHYTAINPQSLVPLLYDDSNQIYLNQSLAIIDYLEEKHSEISLYPEELSNKALAKSLALQICCDIHPLNNLRVLKYLTRELEVDKKHKLDWYHYWLQTGLVAFEKQLSKIDRTTPFCIDDKLTIADICLIPQVYNAKRYNFDLSPFPLIKQINQHCLELAVFKQAAP